MLGFGYGVLLVVNTLVSQAFGRRDNVSVGRYLWQGLWFGLVFGTLTLLLYPVAEPLFLRMGHEPRMATLEGEYLRVVSLAGWTKLLSVALMQCLLGVHRPTIGCVSLGKH